MAREDGPLPPLLPIVTRKSLLISVPKERFRAWPPKDNTKLVSVADPVMLEALLTKDFDSDRHFAIYAVNPKYQYRLRHGAEKQFIIFLLLIVFDFDAPREILVDDKAPDDWWESLRPQFERLRTKHSAIIYRGRKGGRIIMLRKKPLVVGGPEDGGGAPEAYRLRYLAECAWLKRNFEIEADLSCCDWTRLYRAPGAKYEDGKRYSSEITFPERWGTTEIELSGDDWEAGKQSAKAAKGAAAKAKGLLLQLAGQLGLLTGEQRDGGFLGECPNADQHTTGDRMAIYYPAGEGQKYGWIHCFHNHCNELRPLEMHRLLSDRTDPEEIVYLRAALAKAGCTFDATTGNFSTPGKDFEGIYATILLKSLYKRERLDLALTVELAQRKQEVSEALSTRLTYVTDAKRQTAAWLHAVTGREDPTDLAVVQHFIWQVKRKYYGLPVTRHLMPIIVGKQNGGKSTAVAKLVEPFTAAGACLVLRDITLVEDERQQPRIARALVVFADEMSRVSRTDMAALRAWLTGDAVQYRLMRSHAEAALANRSTWIGTANPNVIDLIHDPTGMRRFYELRAQDHLAWEIINSCDYDAIWRSVDHTGPAPILDHLVVLQERQREITAKDSVEEWLLLTCDVTSIGDWISAHKLYVNYARWMQLQRRYPDTEAIWGRRLKALLPDRWKNSDGVKYRLVMINEDDFLA